MTETTMPLIELLRKHDDGDFLRAVSAAVLQLLMEHDVRGGSANLNSGLSGMSA
ncbi:hypothetical protein [Jiella avicenniae]|uniref:Transposase, Mutator family n=1 Tax=Jiella avicenniae TaxID=2907202 RepID=A0A9X1P5Q2_9HYPH|nr:hypothetical protein [Jiella avicenniae]MCE7031013.1 hypothetical protein [Jiella avicenniae]